jgi:hypothetical protein
MVRQGSSGDVVPQTLFDFRIDSFQQVFPLEIGTGFIIREFLTLLRPGHMDRAPFVQFSIVQKNTGTVIFNFEGIPFLDKSFPHFSITKLKVACYPIYIGGGNKENGT